MFSGNKKKQLCFKLFKKISLFFNIDHRENIISTIRIDHWSMLNVLSSLVQGIHMHPTIPGSVTIGPGEIRILSVNFQSFSATIL